MTNTNIMCYGLSSNFDLFRICIDLNIFGLIMSRNNGKPEGKTPLVMEAYCYAIVKGLWICQSSVKHLKCLHPADRKLFNNHLPYINKHSFKSSRKFNSHSILPDFQQSWTKELLVTSTGCSGDEL